MVDLSLNERDAARRAAEALFKKPCAMAAPAEPKVTVQNGPPPVSQPVRQTTFHRDNPRRMAGTLCFVDGRVSTR